MLKRSIIITGAGSGIGQRIAERLSCDETQLVLAGRNLDKLKKTEELCKGPVSSIPLDLESATSIFQFLSKVTNPGSPLGAPLSGLVNNAGIVIRNPFEKAPIEEWQRQMQINLLGPVQLTQGLLPLLKGSKGASIVNISSTLGIKPILDTSAYSSSKAAMNNWTQSLALELAPEVRVNAICPGIVDTPIHDFHENETAKDDIHLAQPMGRLGRPEDIAAMACHLLGEESSWVTGSIFTVDGGISLL